MSSETHTDTVSTEAILKAAGIPQHASIYDFGCNEDGEFEIEWAVDE